MHTYLTLSAGSIFCFLAFPALAANPLCSKEEISQFTCSTGKKSISVCASKDLSVGEGYMQYRFGSKGAPEIQVPAAKNHPNPLVKSGTLVFSGGGGAYLRFLKGDYAYVVYSATVKGSGTKAGVAVEKGEKLIASIKCVGLAQSRLGPKLFEQAGLPTDEKVFTLP